jgi:hypothetical protein
MEKSLWKLPEYLLLGFCRIVEHRIWQGLSAMLAQILSNPSSSRRTTVHIARPTFPEKSCTPRLSVDECAPAFCQGCEMPVTLVRIRPKVASFSEMDTFRCFACGDEQTIRVIAPNATPKSTTG